MRKFFCLSAGLAACSVAGLASAGGPQLQTATMDRELTPIRYAGIDKTGKMTTPWFYTEDVQNDTNCYDTIVFDSYQPEDPDTLLPCCGTDCDPNLQPTSRYYFGPTYCNTWSLNDIDTMAAGWSGNTVSDHHGCAWWWPQQDQCYLTVFTYEDFDGTCNGPAAGNGYDGIIYDFGDLAPGNGYYYTNLTPCDSGLALTLPSDGQGAYDLNMWNFFDGNNFEYADCGQPMLWAPLDAATQGSSTAVQWDDDTDIDANGNCTADLNGNCLNIPDGNLQAPFECYDYAFGLCVDPLGAMHVFFGETGPQDCVVLEVDQLIGGARSTWTLSNGVPGNKGAIVYGFNPGTTNVNGLFGYCASFGIDKVNTNKLVCQKNMDGNGEISCSKPIPVNLVGTRILFQGAMNGTCPDPCDSNLLDLTVQ